MIRKTHHPTEKWVGSINWIIQRKANPNTQQAYEKKLTFICAQRNAN